jgi:hypothetical protein
MSKDRHQILNMLAEGKISVDEAERLLAAIGEAPEKTNVKEEVTGKSLPKYLRVVVNASGKEGGKGEQVNIRVPMSLLRAGIKLKSLIPEQAGDKINSALKEKGVNFDFNDINPDSLDELIQALSDLTVDVESGEENVHIFCE